MNPSSSSSQLPPTGLFRSYNAYPELELLKQLSNAYPTEDRVIRRVVSRIGSEITALLRSLADSHQPQYKTFRTTMQESRLIRLRSANTRMGAVRADDNATDIEQLTNCVKTVIQRIENLPTTWSDGDIVVGDEVKKLRTRRLLEDIRYLCAKLL